MGIGSDVSGFGFILGSSDVAYLADQDLPSVVELSTSLLIPGTEDQPPIYLPLVLRG
jgi:hypothetical protein